MAFLLPELNSAALYADGFEDAYLGFIENHWAKDGGPVAVYSHAKCIAILESQGMSTDEAVDYFEFNVSGAYVGVNTPIFLYEDKW